MLQVAHNLRTPFWQGQQSVAQQLLSQQPITSHSMPVQGGQPVMSQPQFMAGAAQMASRPPSMLGPASAVQQRPQAQANPSLTPLAVAPLILLHETNRHQCFSPTRYYQEDILHAELAWYST